MNIALTCPHCPGGEPFTDQEALRKHIKWDHELQHLLHGADLVGIDHLKKKLDHEIQHAPNGENGLASQKDELYNSTESSEGSLSRLAIPRIGEGSITTQKKKSKDITGDSCGSSISSYHTVDEGE